MSPVCWVLCALLSASCVRSQVVLTQPGSEMKRPGESVKLKCEGSGFTVSSTWMSWVRQAPGKGLEWLVYYLNPSNKYYYSAIQDRFTASKDGSTFFLEIDRLKAEDTATYYCTTERSYYGFDYWGKGTWVEVTSGTPAEPAVYPLVNCAECQSGTNVAIGCLATGHLPEPVEMTWSNGEPINDGFKVYPSVKLQSSNYIQSSQLSVPASDWQSKQYTCTVKHQPSSSTITKGVSNSVCASNQRDPTVQLLLPSCEVNNIELTCLLSNYTPKGMDVKWLVNGKANSEMSRRSTFEESKADSKTFVGRSLLRVTKASWEGGDTYTCNVIREKAKQPFSEMYNISRCSACAKSTPALSVYPVRPSYQDMLNSKASVACLVLGQDLKNARFSWEIDGKSAPPSQPESIEEHGNKTQSRWMKRAVTPDEWDKSTTYQCKVTNVCGTETKGGLITTRDSKLQQKTPTVTLQTPNIEDPSEAESLTLFCDVTNFYPEDISIEWKNNKVLVEKARYTTGPVACVGPACSTYSILRVGKNEGGGDYTCEVRHVTLKTSTETATVYDVFGQKPIPPKVTVLYTLEGVRDKTLLCIAEGYVSRKIAMTWLVDREKRSCSTNSTTVLQPGKLHCTCSLHLTQEEWVKDRTYTCRVYYHNGTSLTPAEESVHSIGHQTAMPFTNITRPSFEELFKHNKSVAICLSEVRNASVNWELNGKGVPSNSSTIGTLTKSTLPITLKQWRETRNLSCQLQHPSVMFPKQTIILKSEATSQMKPPVITLLPPTAEEVYSAKLLTLVCLVKDFYPEDIFVEWENGNSTRISIPIGSAIQCNHSIQLCSLTSLLTVPQAEWLTGTVYICVVGHISLEMSVRRNISLHTGKPVIEDIPRDFHDQGGFDLSELDEAGSVWTTASTFIALFLLTLLYSSFVTFVKVK